MGWNNPPVSWAEVERILSGRPDPRPPGDGGDSPAWTRRRERYVPPAGIGPPGANDHTDGDRTRVPYAELHCHSNFSFLDGASHPEELIETAALLGLDAVALTDHDGMYGVVRFAEAAKELGVRTVFGAELSLGLSAPQNGVADPAGEHLLLLAERQEGYHRLCRTLTNGYLHDDAEKGRPIYQLDNVVDETRDHCVVLTGCRKGAVRQALLHNGSNAAYVQLGRMVGVYGRDRVIVELTDQGLPMDSYHNDLLYGM